MKTMPPGQLANVVNASVTMFFHSVQPIRIGRRLGSPVSTNEPGLMPESSAASFGPPLDLVHLARQCLGDHALEAELLGLFRLQARALTAQLSDPSLLFLEPKAKIAHTLRGSALAVGAWRVARAARRIEELASAGGHQDSAEAGAIAALQSAVAEALAEIERIGG
jgi:hypothetical protein